MSRSARRMPLLFVGHGSPINAVEDNAWTARWAELGKSLPRPEAILCLSAHFVTRGLHAVNAQEPQTIHDFYGFPPALYQIRYPAPGSPALAGRAVSLLNEKAALTDEWGLDHGAWSVLRVMYPQSDVPVTQLSLDLSLSAKEQLDIGAALRPLREEGVLILGSGNIVHNLREIRMDQALPFPWARSFGEAIHGLVLGGDYRGVSSYRSLPGWRESVNTSEHFVPLLNVLGAADERDRAAAFNHDYHWGSLSMTGYVLTDESEER